MLAETKLASVVTGADALCPPIAWREMSVQLRNAGQPGVGAMATSAVDIALWDLKARLLGQPLYRVLPAFRNRVPHLRQRRLHQLPAAAAARADQ